MPYLGTEIAQGFTSSAKDRFNGDNSTTGFTLSRAVPVVNDIQVFVDNIRQEPTVAYSVSGSTLTFTEAPPTGTNNVYVVHTGQIGPTILPPQDLGTTDYIFGDDISLQSDASVLNFGTDSEVNITHVHNTGLLLNSTNQLQFGDSGTYIHQSADGVLDLVSDTKIEINATTIDINGAELVLDADADTSITADTDDTIDVKVGGTDTIKVTGTQTDIKVSASRELNILKDSSDDFLVLKSTAPDASNNLRTIELVGETISFATGASSGTSSTERMRVDNSGNVLIGKTSTGVGTSGLQFESTGTGVFSRDSDVCIIANRQTNDGRVIEIRQSDTLEGSIDVSGSTVSLAGFSGTHESSGISKDTSMGTVVSTIDELDIYVSGSKSGQTRANHAKVKVSDTVGDSAVYGVVSRFDDNDKVFVASVGIGSVRVTGACARGDLLESNGDGTAKVQSDDIVRSKTIGKVTIGNSNTDEKLVSCVLYCG